MKRFLLILLTVIALNAQSQVFNNEWIDYSKTYYKFKVGATGLYRISQPALTSIGIGTIPAENFQLWRNGKEIPIYTSVQSGPFGSSDYIEFWGEMNDGKPDSIMYLQGDYQLSDKWSLETDTVAFFLTVNPAGNNLRLVPTVNDVANNTLAPEPYFWYTFGRYYKDKINSGRSELVGDSYTYSSVYDYGEGWSSNDVPEQSSITYNTTGILPYTGPNAPQPIVKVNAAGNAIHTRNFQLKLNGTVIYDQPLNYYDYRKIVQPVDPTLLSSGVINLEMLNTGTETLDRMVVAQAEVTYAHSFNVGSVNRISFNLDSSSVGNYLQITGFIYSGNAPVLYDMTNGQRYVADISNPVILKFALKPSAVPRKLVVVSQEPANTIAVNSFQQRNFVDYSLPANQGDFLIITHPALTNGANGTNPINDYKNYRSSAAGGGFTAKVYMIDELVDQFGLGIKKHPLSIRNFIRWARLIYSAPLKDVLLIGKGVVYNQYRPSENNPDIEKLALVPTYGYPASDNMLSSDFGSSQPLTPIGRVSAITPDEVAIYLHKLQQYEQVQTLSSPYIADKAWMKNVVHVTGASDDNTNAILETALNGHATIISDTLYGGNVITFSKSSADAVQTLNSTRLTNLMNNGIGVLTYFGHSSASTLEFNLDNPMNYTNVGKYPVFIVMGCNAGNFFNFSTARFFSQETLSERYVLAPERGSVAFIASTHLGIVHYLDIYNTQFYTAISNTKYGRTIGEQMDEAIRQVFNLTTENDFYARFQCEQFCLHGDPALKIYAFDKPDYVIEDPYVKVSPSFISVADGQFSVKASFLNIGKSPGDSITVKVERTFPAGNTEVFRTFRLPGTRYIDSIMINDFPIDPNRDKGLNKITITIDADGEVDELYENNNSVTKDVFIFEDEARPIFPYNFSIVNQQNPKLVVSSANAFAVSRDYIMEMDTTELFNSPYKITRTTTSSGGVFEFTPGITLLDSTVYYWRVSPVAPSGSLVWNTASFVYLPGSDDGFNQSHIFQHFKSQYERMTLDSASRLLSYTDRNRAFTQALGFSVVVDEDDRIKSVCGVSNVVFNVLDPVSLKPWLNNQAIAPATYPVPGQFGSDPVCGDNRAWNFQFNILDTAKRRSIVQFLDMIPDGYYVIVRNCSYMNDLTPSLANTYASTWQGDTSYLGPGNSMYHRLLAQGFSTIDSFNRSRAFVFMYKKNGSSTFTPRYTFSEGIYDAISMSIDLLTPDTLGYISSPAFGPAKGWKQLHWRGTTTDASGGDLPKVNVYGVSNTGVETLLIPDLDPSQQDVDISSIDAHVYPYVKLKMKDQDSIHLTPYQLRYWRLTYIPVPEGAIAPNLYFTSKDQTEVGEPAYFGVAFKNISKVDFDSVLVKFSITDKDNVKHDSSYRLKKLVPGDTTHIYVPIDTRLLSGHNTVFVNFNPDNDQPEQYLFNNFAFRDLYVKPDSLHPLLDVTFDGVHILNHDIVSSRPNIIVKLKDEAKWMVLNDTSLLQLHVRYPDGTLRRFNFDNDTLQFNPPGAPPVSDNTATLNFRPYFLADGDYELIVTGKDRSENSAGNLEYRVGFQVINKPMISNMLNYPNPFTTSTAFVFTITGFEVPQNIRIQILTITGKIVREITKTELGPLHIGRNITEFKWDGTDQYGQKLGNGVYLYRVITNLNGKSLDKYKASEDDTDKYFNKGYGKMYLMR
ncbi:MAG: hypothetical protein E6H09_10700 [Bacteroidetes bacterium]|nr:MAG: hypothetical protein E6H09_10700 [Bacteroidota bacterium]